MQLKKEIAFEKVKNVESRNNAIFTLYLNKIQAVWVYDIYDFLQLIPQDFSSFRTDYYMLCLYKSGKGRYSMKSENITISEKDLLLILPNTINQFHRPFDYKGKVLVFTDSVFIDTPARIHFLYELKDGNNITKDCSLFEKKCNKEITCLFQMIENELQEPYDEIQKQILSNYLFNILLIREKFINCNSNKISNQKLDLVKKFKKKVYNEENKNQPIKYYASALNVSITTLEKVFKRFESKTPKKWLSHLIIQELKKKLIYNELTIKELTAVYGFSETTNFIKFFKKHTGFTPKQFKLYHDQNQY